MGMPFPTGMRMASDSAPEMTAWFWGINGALSVCGSVFSAIIALYAGVAATFWTGFAAYVLAAAMYVRLWSRVGDQKEATATK